MLYIVGRPYDVHIAALHDAALRIGVDATVLGPGSYFKDSLGECSVSPGDVILWRLKPATIEAVQHFRDAVRQFEALEWRDALRGICDRSRAIVLNSYEAVVAAGSKPRQLRCAADLGFTVPRHLISNDKDALVSFFDSCSPARVLKKPLVATHVATAADVNAQLLLGPRVVEASELAETPPENFAACPVLLQECIEKIYELRVIVVGSSIIAVKVDSQLHEDTRLDWRAGIFRDMYEFIELDEPLKRRLCDYLRLQGLFSGVFDLIKSTDGTVIFLECNPNGQWMWLDYLKPGLIPETFVQEAVAHTAQQLQPA